MAFVWTVMLICFNILLVVILYYRRKRLPGEPPLKVCMIPFVGGALSFGRNPYGYLKNLQKQFGDIFSVRMAGWNYTVIMNPSDIKSIERCKTLTQNTVVGDFVTCMVGPEHSVYNQKQPSNEDTNAFQERNKAVARAIKDNLRGPSQLKHLYQISLKNTVKIIKQVMEEKIQLPQQSNTGDLGLYDLCKDLIYYITHYIMLGSPPDDEENLQEAKALLQLFQKFNKDSVLLADRVPIHFLPATRKARSRVFEFLKHIKIYERENVPDMILQMLNSDMNEENQIRHLTLLLWTAQANTTPGLFWSLFYILKHPDVRQEIVKELENLIKSKKQQKSSGGDISNARVTLDDISELEKDDLDKLVAFDAILKETFRINGSSMNVRKATADTTFKTHDNKRYNIRKGDYTFFYTPIMHLDPEIYDEPEKFNFERFLDKKTFNQSEANAEPSKNKATLSKNRKNGSQPLYTFGFGGGKCPGRHLAIMEIKLMILSLLTCFDPKLLSDHTPKADLTHIGFGIMPPASDVLISLPKKR